MKSAGANGRDSWSMPEAERRKVDPTADYVSADAQITDTIGVHMRQFQNPEDREVVKEADDKTTRQVLEAFDRPRKVGAAKLEKDKYHPVKKGKVTTVGRVPNPDDKLPRFEDGPPLPSMGEPREDCRDDLAMFCDSCGETFIGSRTCGQSKCPECWTSWCRDYATKKAEKLVVTRAVRDEIKDEQQYFHHLAWSVPDDWALQADNPFRRTKQVINEVLDAMGLDAFVAYHAWRGADEDADGEEIENDLGEWAPRIGSDTTWEDVREELEFSPHFHVIAVGNHVPGGELTKRVEEEVGWSLHRITKGEDSNVSLFDNSDMVSAVMYCLSHASLKQTEAGNNVVKAWEHGPILNQRFEHEEDVENPDDFEGLIIREETSEEMDLLARGHAPLTLGVELESQICTHEFEADPDRETGADRAGVRTLLTLGTGDTRQWTPSGQGLGTANHRTELPSSGSVQAGELPDDAELPEAVSAATTGTVTEVEEIDHDREGVPDEDDPPEMEVCQGRMLPIWEAESFISDSEWREQAENVHELDATWAEWAPKLEAMLDNFEAG